MSIRWIDAVLVGVLGCGSSPSGSGMTPCSPPDAGGAHFALDPKDGKCKLDGTTTNVGAACMGITPTICGTDQNASCLDALIDDFPGGYCNVDPCSDVVGHLCPIGSSCVQLNGENPQCFKDCSSDADCRKAEGYFCLDMTADDHPNGLWTSGASHKVCSRQQLTCPASNQDCPTAIPRCVLPDGGVAYTEGGVGVPAPADGGAPPTPICVK